MSSDRVDASISQSARRQAILVYLTMSAFAHLAWEVLQLPLYTIWNTGTLREKAFAVAHCTAGDVLIATSCLAVALIITRAREWPRAKYFAVAIVAIVLGVLYTAFSEWLNVSIRGSWAYSEWMPVIRLGTIRIGLSPLLQWMVVPTMSFLCVRRAVVHSSKILRCTHSNLG